ncbi:hypothetical protein ABH925_006441 [Streptacidiphilus sp. EB129]
MPALPLIPSRARHTRGMSVSGMAVAGPLSRQNTHPLPRGARTLRHPIQHGGGQGLRHGIRQPGVTPQSRAPGPGAGCAPGGGAWCRPGPPRTTRARRSTGVPGARSGGACVPGPGRPVCSASSWASSGCRQVRVAGVRMPPHGPGPGCGGGGGGGVRCYGGPSTRRAAQPAGRAGLPRLAHAPPQGGSAISVGVSPGVRVAGAVAGGREARSVFDRGLQEFGGQGTSQDSAPDHSREQLRLLPVPAVPDSGNQTSLT